MQIRRILVANTKGGCGKTTIATNLASYFAQSGRAVRLFDHDSQRSALQWLRRRDDALPHIEGVDASKHPDNRMTRSWQMRIPPGTQDVIVDTPAGIDVPELASMLGDNNFLIIPVLPSPIDIESTANFIEAVLHIGKARKRQIRISVVANRVRPNTRIYAELEHFLGGLDIPCMTSLRDTQAYVRAVEQGVGVQELKHTQTARDRLQWAPLIHWLDAPLATPRAAEISPIYAGALAH